jgi:hypothetical protein
MPERPAILPHDKSMRLRLRTILLAGKIRALTRPGNMQTAAPDSGTAVRIV